MGQLWRQGSTSNLNLRSYDGSTVTGRVTVEWDATIFWNGGESIDIGSGMVDDAVPGTTYHLYHEGEGGNQILTANADNISDWSHMKLGQVVAASTGTSEGSTGEVSGPPTEPL